MDSRFRGNDDTQTAAEVHVVVRMKWYNIGGESKMLGAEHVNWMSEHLCLKT